MVKQQDFETRYQGLWQTIEKRLEDPKGDLKADFPQAYRHLCHQLALAKHRCYSPQLINRLNALVLKSHHRFYEHKSRYEYQWLRFMIWDFPRTLRQNASFVFWALALFLVPGLIMGFFCYFDDAAIYSLMPAGSVRELEALYDPAVRILGRERESDSDFYMFGFYIKNNIGVSFRTFAGGIFYGIGSAFFLVFNGLFLGAAAGHLTQLGYTQTFYPFVIGHGAFELTAIIFSGAAGLKLGKALIDPGPLKRVDALRDAGRDAVKIIYGAILMLVIAAFLEAFWSSSTNLPNAAKYGVGAIFWMFVLSYCLFCGRAHGSQPH